MKTYMLVYQVGIANVFRVSRAESSGASPHYDRVFQGSYGQAEDYCRGLIEAGCPVSVWHSDVAGDVLLCPEGPWAEGPGDLWRGQKHPPFSAEYATAS